MTSGERNALRAWLDLLTASNSIRKAIDANLRREFSMTISRFDLLAALERAGSDGLRASDLSKKLLVTEGATTQIVTPLIRQRLVSRTPCPNDGRAVNLRLTRKGHNLFEKMARVHKQWIDETFATLSPGQVSSLRQLIGKLDLPHLADDRKEDAA